MNDPTISRWHLASGDYKITEEKTYQDDSLAGKEVTVQCSWADAVKSPKSYGKARELIVTYNRFGFIADFLEVNENNMFSTSEGETRLTSQRRYSEYPEQQKMNLRQILDSPIGQATGEILEFKVEGQRGIRKFMRVKLYYTDVASYGWIMLHPEKKKTNSSKSDTNPLPIITIALTTLSLLSK